GNLSTANNAILRDMPTVAGSTISPVESGVTGFTDIFNNILSWFKQAPGLKYVYSVIAAPFNILKCMNLPPRFVAGIGTFWYLISFIVLVAFLWGRE
ncbi:unnamed protein product, partial [marine sediment metagenome]